MDETERLTPIEEGFAQGARALGLGSAIVPALAGAAARRERLRRVLAAPVDDRSAVLPHARGTADEPALSARLAAMHPERLVMLLAAEPGYVLRALAAAPPALVPAAARARIEAALAGRDDESPAKQTVAITSALQAPRLLRALLSGCPDLRVPARVVDPEQATPVGSSEDTPYFCLCLLGARVLGRSLSGAAPAIRARAAHAVGPVFEAEVTSYASRATAEARARARAQVRLATLCLGPGLETRQSDERLAAIGLGALVARPDASVAGAAEVERLRWLLPPWMDALVDWGMRGRGHG